MRARKSLVLVLLVVLVVLASVGFMNFKPVINDETKRGLSHRSLQWLMTSTMRGYQAEYWKFTCVKNLSKDSSVRLLASESKGPTYNGVRVSVKWSGVPAMDGSLAAAGADWIGLYCQPNAPIHQYYGFRFVSDTSGKSISETDFIVYNIRSSYYQFRYYRTYNDCTHLLGYTNLSPQLMFKGGADTPTQGHIALTGNPMEMRIQWTSGTQATPTVRYGYSSNELIKVSTGTSITYTASDLCNAPANDPKYFINPGYLHDVVLRDLTTNSRIYYQYGSSDSGFSQVHNFTTAPSGHSTRGGFQFVTYGDMGLSDTPGGAKDTMANVLRDINKGAELVMHQGDLSYARGYAQIWDQWMNFIEPIATRVPYMVGIGNHEQGFGYNPAWGNYGDDSAGECGVPARYRFHMPDNGNSIYWYSFDYGLVHFTVINTEHNLTSGSTQFRWVEKDFKGVDRSKTPWLLVVGHRPMYCSEIFPSDNKVDGHIRGDGLEDLFQQYGVDLALWGHYHSYERTCKVYKGKCVDSGGVVNIVIGSAGATLDDDAPLYKAEWSKHFEYSHGYGRVTVANESALLWEFVRNSDPVVVPDKVWLKK